MRGNPVRRILRLAEQAAVGPLLFSTLRKRSPTIYDLPFTI